MGGIVSGLFGASTPSVPNIQVWQPQYTGQADTQAYNAISGINSNNPYAANAGNYQGVLNQSLANPYAAPAQSSANAAGGQLATTGAQGGNASTAVNAGAMSLLPFVSQVENTAMDPQSALYKRTLQQVQDQTGVSNAQNGLTNTPYGAGVQNQALSNFNIDWQNNQLARQTQGLQAVGQGVNQAGTAATTAQNLGAAAAGATTQAGQVPLQAYNTNLQNVQQALNNYGQSTTAGNTNTQTAVADLLNYMGLGAQQSNAQANFTQQNYTNQLNAANATNQGISSLVNSMLGGLNAGGGAFSSGYNQAGANSLSASSGFVNSAPSTDAEWMSFLAMA